MNNSQKFREQLRALNKKMRTLQDTAKKEDRAFTSDDDAKWSAMMEERNTIMKNIEREELLEKDERKKIDPVHNPQATQKRSNNDDEVTYDSAFESYLRDGFHALNAEQRKALATGVVSNGEKRNVTNVPAQGGYLVNDTFGDRIIEEMKAQVGFLGISNLYTTTTGADLYFPTLDETNEFGERMGEKVPATLKNMTFGQFKIGAHKYGSHLICISSELLQDNSYDLQGRIAQIAAARIGRIINSDMTIGHAGSTHIGAGNTGLVQTAVASGVTIPVDTINWDILVDLKHSVDASYRASGSAAFAFSDRTLCLIMKMKDNEGRPLWIPSTRDDEPGRVIGSRYVVNNFMPEADTAGNAPVLFGDFSKYQIRVSRGITVKRSEHSSFAADAVDYLAIMRVDAGLESPNAIKSLAVV